MKRFLLTLLILLWAVAAPAMTLNIQLPGVTPDTPYADVIAKLKAAAEEVQLLNAAMGPLLTEGPLPSNPNAVTWQQLQEPTYAPNPVEQPLIVVGDKLVPSLDVDGNPILDPDTGEPVMVAVPDYQPDPSWQELVITGYRPAVDADGNPVMGWVGQIEGFLGATNTPPSPTGYVSVSIPAYRKLILPQGVSPTTFSIVLGTPVDTIVDVEGKPVDVYGGTFQ